MKTYHKNPRQITKKQFSDLETWLAELGDLSGIVHDLNSDEIVSGNMRSRVFNIDECEVEITEQYDQPDIQGTVAHGYVVWQGKKYAYRQVRWTTEQCEKANIIANKAGGDFNFDILGNDFNIDNLLEWGFTNIELGIVDALDYSDLDNELEMLEGMEEVVILIRVPEKFKDELVKWMANGELHTAAGLGKGVLKRCGLL